MKPEVFKAGGAFLPYDFTKASTSRRQASPVTNYLRSPPQAGQSFLTRRRTRTARYLKPRISTRISLTKKRLTISFKFKCYNLLNLVASQLLLFLTKYTDNNSFQYRCGRGEVGQYSPVIAVTRCFMNTISTFPASR